MKTAQVLLEGSMRGTYSHYMLGDSNIMVMHLMAAFQSLI